MSSLDKFRNRKSEASSLREPQWVVDKTLAVISRKRGEEELRITTGKTEGTWLAGIQTFQKQGNDWIEARRLTFPVGQIEALLESLDQASIRYQSLASIPEEDLPKLPLLCGEASDLQVRLDRFKGYFNIKLSKRSGPEWAVISPADVDPMIDGLVQAYDRLTGKAPVVNDDSDLPF